MKVRAPVQQLVRLQGGRAETSPRALLSVGGMLMKLALLPPESWVPKKAQETTGSGWRGPAWLSAAAAPGLYQNQDMPQDCHLLVFSGHCISFQRKGPWVEQQKRLDHQVTQPLLSLKTALEGIFCPRSHWPQHRTVVLEPVM